MNTRFDDRIVAVSGVGSPFGRAMAGGFAALGGRVFGCDIRAEAFDDLRERGVDTRLVDLADRAAATAWIRDIEARTASAVDVLVNNAGGVAGQERRPLEEVADDDWDRVLAVNLGAAFALSRAAASGMKRARSGSIVNVSSGAALRASRTGIQAYCAAKHAVLGLTRQLAHELGPFGIRVNSVAPGFVRTNTATERQWAGLGADGQRALVRGVAMRRLGTPDEIANVVIFLASDLASFVNGEILSVDGGR